MKIYLDGIFLENLIANSIVLLQTAYFLKMRIKKKRIVLSTILGSLYVCIMLVTKLRALDYVISKIVLSIVMISIAFNPKTTKSLIKELLVFYVINILTLGTIYFITNITNSKLKETITKTIIYGISFTVTYVLRKYLWKMYSIDIKKSALEYIIKMRIGDKEYKQLGFIDTGNSIMYAGEPVIFADINSDLLKKLKKENHEKVYVNCKGISGVRQFEGYRIENIQIKRNNNIAITNAVVCFSEYFTDDNKCNMLLPYSILEIMEGVKI